MNQLRRVLLVILVGLLAAGCDFFSNNEYGGSRPRNSSNSRDHVLFRIRSEMTGAFKWKMVTLEEEPPVVSQIGACTLTEWDIHGTNTSYRYQTGPWPACYRSFEAFVSDETWAGINSRGHSFLRTFNAESYFEGTFDRDHGVGEGAFATGHYRFTDDDGQVVDEGTFDFFERQELFPCATNSHGDYSCL